MDYGPNLVELFFETFQNSGKKRFLAAILANIGLRNSQADIGLDAAQFCVLHTLRSTKSTTASWTLNVASSLGAPTPPWCRALTLRPVICGGRRSGFCSKHIWRLVCRKLRPLSPLNGRFFFIWEDVTEDRTTTQVTSHSLRGHGSRWAFQRCYLHSCGLVRNKEEWPWVVSISRSNVNRAWWAVLIKAWWNIDK